MSASTSKKGQKIYKQAPITEALLDVRFTLPNEFSIESFEKLHNSIKDDYPIKQLNTKNEFSIEIKNNQTAKQEAREIIHGYWFKSADGKKILQFNRDGFTFNKLKPYDNWGSFSSEAMKYLKEYIKISNPINITRLAVRYINRLDIPLPVSDLSEYIKTVPEIADGAPQEMTEFFMRLVIPDTENSENIAIITETIDKKSMTTMKTTLPIIFDIDVYRNVNIKPGDSQKYEKILESLRAYKNTLFEKSTTEKMQKLIS